MIYSVKLGIAALFFSGMIIPAGAQTAKRQLSMEQLFKLVEDNSKTLRTQKTSADIAQKGIEVAKSQRLPDINTSLSFSYIGNALMTDRDLGNAQGLHSPHFGNSFALEASQTVYAGGAINAGINMAQLQQEQAGISIQQSREQLRFLALGQYLDIYKLQNRMLVVKSNIALTQKLIDDIKAKQKQGMALKNDITRYELQMQTLNLELTRLQNQNAIINHQLCNTLGIQPEEQIEPDENMINNVYAKDGEAQWQIDAAVNAPALQMAAVNERIATQQEKLARSEMLPKVAVVAADNFDGPITYELPPIDKNINVWYLGVGVKYPLSSLFKSNKRVKQAAIATQQTREAHAAANEQINNAVQAAYTEYLQSYVELETQQKSVQLARQNYQVINDRYLNQLALITDMIDASNIRLNAELQEVDARINIAYAYYKMKYIAGKL
jgi:outer membrane protein TolC